jgi:hypothetical protein
VTLGGYDFVLTLRCVGCDILSSVIELEAPYGTSIIGSSQKTIVCPDQLTATWSLDLGGGIVGTLDIECKGCGDQCSLSELGATSLCCPYRSTPIPPGLYATVEGGCSPLVGGVAGLINTGPIGAPSNCWSGTFQGPDWIPVNPGDTCTVRLSLACLIDENGDYNWYMSNASLPCQFSSPMPVDSPMKAEVISCEPLELLFTVGPEGCCNDRDHDFGVDGMMVVRVLE